MVSSKLSQLQHDVVDAFFCEPSAFFLTGGAALAGFYLGQRTTVFALLDQGHELAKVLKDARTKDGAVDPGTLAWALSTWRLGPSTPLPEGNTLEQIEQMRMTLIDRLVVLAVPAS